MAVVIEPVPTKSAIDPYRAYRKGLLSTERVRELSQLRPNRAILDALCCWTTIVAAWGLVAVLPCWWTVLLAVPIIGMRYYGLFIIGHDGLHRRLFANPRLNDIFNDLFVLGPIGAITRINNRNHISHHHHLATDQDPDRHKHSCSNKANLAELLGYLTGATSLWRSLRNVFFRSASSSAATTEPSPRYTLRDLAILLGWQAALLGGLTFGIGWWAWPVLWLFPVYMFTFLADNLRAFADHSHPKPDREADEHRLITYISNPIERLFLSPMNMNYHAVHHLWPSIPYYNLSLADEAIRGTPAAKGLEWRRSYLGYLWRYSRALPLHECKAAVETPNA